MYKTIKTIPELQELTYKLSKAFAIDTETTSLDLFDANLLGISICDTEGTAYYIPVETSHQGSQASIFEEPTLTLTEIRTELNKVLGSDYLKYMHNSKFDLNVLRNHGFIVEQPVFDTMLATWVIGNLQGARFGLKELADRKLGMKMTELREIVNYHKGMTIKDIPIDIATGYAAADADATYKLAIQIIKNPVFNQLRHIIELETTLTEVLLSMERHGVLFNQVYLERLDAGFQRALTNLEGRLAKELGGINISSVPQLKETLTKLFGEELESVDKFALKKLRKKNPRLIKLLEAYRRVEKLKSTYTDGVLKLIHHTTGRVHTSFKQAGIATGRLSSREPNMQNIPNNMRKAIIPEEGYILVSIDYSQVELRILAHLCKDEPLVYAFFHGEDVHAKTASLLYHKPINEVTKSERKKAKIINFGIVYGISKFGLSKRSGMTEDEAEKFIEDYFAVYPGIKGFLDRCHKMVRTKRYVETEFGRRRWFSEVNPAALREATNLPIQGLAADIMKKAMLECHRLLKGKKSRMISQVHDELVFEIHESEYDLVPQLANLMTTCYKLDVPLLVDIEYGYDWGNLFDWPPIT